MRILTFNVNGLRSIKEYYQVAKGWTFDQLLDSLNADIICFQESKINEADKLERDLALPHDYTGYFSFQRGKKKIGYSGVITYCRKGQWEPKTVEEGFTGLLGDQSLLIGPHSDLLQLYTKLELLDLDSEGRCIISDHGDFILFNVYFPNDSGPERDDFRSRFYPALWTRVLQFLKAGRSVIILGDINIAAHPRDHCDFAKAYSDWAGDRSDEVILELFGKYFREDWRDPDVALLDLFYGERPMRKWLYTLVNYDKDAHKYGLRDVFRSFHPHEYEKYTHWNTLLSARGTNYGSRIDAIYVAGPLFQANKSTADCVKNCNIWPEYMGSDHCPVWMDLELSPPCFPHPAKSISVQMHRAQRCLSDFLKPRPQSEAKPVTSTTEPDLKGQPRVKKSKITDYFPKAQQADLPPETAHSRQGDYINQPLEEDYIDQPLEEILQLIEATEQKTQESSILDKTESWKDLFNKPRLAPFCKGHSEPCKLLTVNKKGPNKGRQFWICSRGVGNTDDPTTRCDHFEWYTKPKNKPP